MVAKFAENLVTKYDANLDLSPRSRQVPIESPRDIKFPLNRHYSDLAAARSERSTRPLTLAKSSTRSGLAWKSCKANPQAIEDVFRGSRQ
ncbi:hypothetical protein TNCV_4493281 [Trichonephila clavipes]|uniref:Uncharacterized protein n=1 Tax=Trichonephila clavipes TaxID=2585209 RepID=A0A8X6SPF4_TRICX|nr:hypothetical protein TNCV_4493281 [Trichonephila clavipes]